MDTDNLSAVLLEAGDLRMKQVPIPGDPLKNEVLLRTLSVGICGSDVHYWKTGRIGDFIVEAPMILGHETSAVVVKIGEGVKHLKVGDRVAVEPGVPCKSCDFCKNGTYNLCPDITFHATPPYDGTLTRYFKHAADYCFKLPDNVSPDEGALLEPLSVGVHACRRADIKVGQKVLITGAGCIGLVSILSANAFGASKIFVTDINEERLKLAKKLGAHGTYTVQKGDTVDAIAAKVTASLDGPPDVTIECSGAESSVNLAIQATRPSGVVVIVGMGNQTVTIPLVTAGVREIDIRGVFRYKNTYPLCLSLLSEGKINLKQLVTHRFKLEKSLDAFETAKRGEGIKIIIDCDRNAA